MRNLLALTLTLFLTHCSFAQLPTTNSFDIDRRIREEGKPYYVTISSSGQTFGAGVLLKNISGGSVVYPGHVLIPKAFNMEATRSLGLYMQIGSGAPTGYYNYQVATIGKNQFAGELLPVTEGSSINTIAERFDSSDGDAPFSVRGSVIGTLMSKGYDKKADFNIVGEGDSIMENAAYTAGGDVSLFQGIIREYFCAPAVGTTPGKVARFINKAKGSINSTNLIAMMNAGSLDISEPVHHRLIEIGTNDIIQGYQANGNALTQPQIDAIVATYSTNLTARIQQIIKRYGIKTKLLILGPPPIYNTVQEAAMVQLRNATKTVVSSLGGAIWNGGSTPIAAPANNIWCLNTGQTSTQSSLWTPNSYTYYIEQTGNALHPNAAGSLLMGNYITNFYTVNNITLN